MAGSNTKSLASKQVKKKKINNPTGIGGFQKHPELRGTGTWDQKDSISEQYQMLIRISVKGFKDWLLKYPEDVRTMAQEIAYNAVIKARKDLKYLVEVTNRTEGTAVSRNEVSGPGGEPLEVKITDARKRAIIAGVLKMSKEVYGRKDPTKR